MYIEVHKSWNFSLYNFLHTPVPSFLFGLNILLRQGVEQEIADTHPRGNLIFELKSLLVLLLIIQSLFCIFLCLYCSCIIEVHTVHFVGNCFGVLTEAMKSNCQDRGSSLECKWSTIYYFPRSSVDSEFLIWTGKQSVGINHKSIGMHAVVVLWVAKLCCSWHTSGLNLSIFTEFPYNNNVSY
jgi:hypothetical protein